MIRGKVGFPEPDLRIHKAWAPPAPGPREARVLAETGGRYTLPDRWLLWLLASGGIVLGVVLLGVALLG